MTGRHDYMSAAYHAEVREAIARARAVFPRLGPNGLDAEPFEDFEGSDRHIATAIAFLRHITPTKTVTVSSYRLKHCAEEWGEVWGMSPYVSNGAVIAAAVYLGFVVTAGPMSINADVGVSQTSLRVVRAASERERVRQKAVE